MMNLRISRHLKTKDVEWFRVANLDINFECYILFIDTHRPSTSDDYPHLKRPLDEVDRELAENPNFIKVLIFTQKEIKDNKILEELEYIVEGLLSQVITACYSIEYRTFRIKREKGGNRLEREYINEYINNYLVKNFGFTKKSLHRFKNPTFHFLTQEKKWNKSLEKKYKIKFS